MTALLLICLWVTLGALLPPLDIALCRHRLAVVQRIAARHRIVLTHGALQHYRDRLQHAETFYQPATVQLGCMALGALLLPVVLVQHVQTLIVLSRAP